MIDKKESMLEWLSYDGKRIIDFELSENKEVLTLTEGCDQYYYVKISKKELELFILELQQIHDKMK